MYVVFNHVLSRSEDLVVKYIAFIIHNSMVDLASHKDCFKVIIKYRNSATLIIKNIKLAAWKRPTFIKHNVHILNIKAYRHAYSGKAISRLSLFRRSCAAIRLYFTPSVNTSI